MSEEVLGIIGNLEGRGKARAMRRYTLIFTSTRIIVAKITGALGMALTAALGVTFLGPLGASEVINVYDQRASEKSDEIRGMKANNILEADKLNYAISHSHIAKIEIKKGGILSSPKITISTTDKKYPFRIVEKKAFDDIVALMGAILPHKVSVT